MTLRRSIVASAVASLSYAAWSCASFQTADGPGDAAAPSADAAGFPCPEVFATGFDLPFDGGVDAAPFTSTHTPGASLAWSRTEGSSVAGSLEAIVGTMGQAQIDGTFRSAPTAVRVSFATKLAQSGTGANIAFGCNVLLMISETDYALSVTPRGDDTNVSVDLGSSAGDLPATIAETIDRSAWMKFVFEMTDITAGQLVLTATVDGKTVLAAQRTKLSALPKAVRLVCGIDDTKAPATVYVDDIHVSICTQ